MSFMQPPPNNNNAVKQPGGERDIPKTGALARMKNAPKDQIPTIKAPRRQKSSRFYVKEKVQVHKTPGFHGK